MDLSQLSDDTRDLVVNEILHNDPAYRDLVVEFSREGDLYDSEARVKEGGHNRSLGFRGEDCAVALLVNAGWHILERNWTCPVGEADIIALGDGALHFVEVKTRIGIEKGFPAEAVGPAKRHKYEKIALYYLNSHGEIDSVRYTFDIVSVVVMNEHRASMRFMRDVFVEDCGLL